jgi:anthranilate/para-aminobenzoate synthase component I
MNLDFLKDFDVAQKPETFPVPYEDPLTWFINAGLGREGDVLFHGSGDGDPRARFSTAAFDPSFILSVSKEEAVCRSGGNVFPVPAAPDVVLAALDGFMERNRRQNDSGFFRGGLACMVSYEMNEFFEKIENRKPTPGPYLWCAFYPRVRVFDAVKKEAYDVSWNPPKPAASETAADLSFSLSPFWCDESKSEYLAKIREIKSLISEGVVYQVNLSRLLSAKFGGSPLGLYAALVERNPASFGAFLNGGDFQLLSLSPELFVSINDGRIRTSPIKGTSPRSTVAAEDSLLRRRLMASEKNRAENLMIVDLMRSDLGRVCKPGTVVVEELFRCETLPTVHHLVSTVSGELSLGAGLGRILRAIWPGGSVTGAPKVSAMEVIAKMETTARGPYCGSLVAWGLDGSVTASLLIRTLFLSGGTATYRTGGGITADSDPEEEFEETAVKASVLDRVCQAVST